MGFMDSVKNAVTRAKMNGELMMIDREINSFKEKTGVALYSILYKRHHNDKEKSSLPLYGLEAAFIAVTEDLQDMIDKRKQVDQAIDALEEAREQRAPGATTGEKAKNAGSSLKDAAALAKLNTEMAFYGREIAVRQGIFGLQIFDDLDLLSHDEHFPEDGDGVGKALNEAKTGLSELIERKRQKEEEIKSI